MPTSETGRRIRQVRRKLGLTQAQFGERIGVINVSIARYEAGRIPHARVLDKIATLGRVSVDWLLHGDRGAPATPSPEPRAVASNSPSLRSPLASLESQLSPNHVGHLPKRYRERYLRRTKEVIERARRELEEYTKVLEAERRANRAKRRRKG